MRQKNEPPKAAIRAVGLRRLLMLADQLDKTPMEPTKTTCGFDYNQWVGDDWENGNNSLCGTTGCALGIGATMPALRRAGLCFKRNVGDHGIVGLKHNVAANSIDAAMFVFALEHLEAPLSVLSEHQSLHQSLPAVSLTRSQSVSARCSRTHP